MTQFPVLTPETQTIALNYLNNTVGKSFRCEPAKQLMVSLYSLMPGADSKVIDILKDYIVPLSDEISGSDINRLKSEYPAVVKFCHEHKDDHGLALRRRKELLIPPTLVDLCMSLVEPKSGRTVFAPYSGDGSFAYHMADCTVEGFEEDDISWAFSQILFHSQGASANIRLGDTSIPEGKLYDYIFAAPPVTSGRDWVDTIYNLITKNLAENGELCCILPMSFCSGSRWFNIRKILWDYRGQFSALVISLPRGIVPHSVGNFCIFYITKNNLDKLILVDAKGGEFLAQIDVAGVIEYSLKVKSIIETINSGDEKYVWVGSSSQLTGYVDLNPSRYLLPRTLPQPQMGEKCLRISDVAEVVRMTKKEEETIPYITMNNLSDSYINCDINDINSLKKAPPIRSLVLTSDCLLVGFIGDKFKVGRLHGVTPSTPVALSNGIIPIKVISDEITEDFFLRCIMSDLSRHQGRMLASGYGLASFTRHEKDFLSIQIHVPRKEQQEALCKEDTRTGLTDADRRILDTHEEFRKDMHMKKHAIGQTIFNINNWWNLLKLAREKGNGIVDDRTELGSNRKVKVADIYTNLEIAMAKLNTQLSKFDTGYGLKTENIPLTSFIEHYISEHKSPLFEYYYDSNAHHAESDLPEVDSEEDSANPVMTGEYILREGDPLEYAIFSPEALTIVFNNIISNACAHGFKGRAADRNVIRIEILSEGTDYVITISNNGEPLKELTSQDVLTYGMTTEHSKTTDVEKNHFGIGGYEIKKLMTEFEGDVEVISTPNEEFTVKYRLIFHKTNIEFVF